MISIICVIFLAKYIPAPDHPARVYDAYERYDTWSGAALHFSSLPVKGAG